mgnify:CR=1 FL=1
MGYGLEDAALLDGFAYWTPCGLWAIGEGQEVIYLLALRAEI